MNSNEKKFEDDVFLETLEIFINSILYIREVYPSSIFRKRKMHNTGVFVSIFPPLNEYLLKVLTTAQQLKKENKLHQVELIIYNKANATDTGANAEEILEKFIFRVERTQTNGYDEADVDATTSTTEIVEDKFSNVKYLMEFEEKIRQALIHLDQTAKSLIHLEGDLYRFRITLHTTEAAFVDIVDTENSKLTNFHWIQQAGHSTDREGKKSWHILPIMKTNSFSAHIQTSANP